VSDIVSATRTHLLADTATAAIVGTRVYFGALPQSATLPAIVVELSQGEVADRHLTATGSLYRSAVNIYAYGATHATAAALGDAIHAAVEFAAGTWGSVSVSRAMVENTQDVPEPPRDASGAWRFVRAIFAIIWHN